MMEDKDRHPLSFPALALSMATGGPPAIALSLLLVDISASFNTSIGVMSQISTISSFMSILMALFMGILSVKYSYKRLLLTGLSLICVSMIGSGLSPSYTFMFLVYSLTGIGYSMVYPMTTTYIARFYPVEKRTDAIGKLIAGRSISSMIAPVVIGAVVSWSNWRWGFLGYGLPLVIFSFFLVYIGIPEARLETTTGGDINFLDGLRNVASKGSAVACIFSGVLAITPFTAISVFNGSYLRQHFLLPMSTVSMLMPLYAIFVTVGLLSSGRIVSKFGLKRIVVFTSMFEATAYLLYFALGLPLVFSLVFSSLGAFMTGVRLSSSNSLNLEQVPMFRGTMMSLNAAASGLGGVIGASVGGYMLMQYGYWGLGSIVSLLGFVAAVIYHMKVKTHESEM